MGVQILPPATLRSEFCHVRSSKHHRAAILAQSAAELLHGSERGRAGLSRTGLITQACETLREGGLSGPRRRQMAEPLALRHRAGEGIDGLPDVPRRQERATERGPHQRRVLPPSYVLGLSKPLARERERIIRASG